MFISSPGNPDKHPEFKAIVLHVPVLNVAGCGDAWSHGFAVLGVFL